MLRMIEAHRTKYRVDVVNDLRSLCRRYGFKADLVGGIYYLQGRLAKLVAESLVTGLFWLDLLFIVIAWLVARTIRGAFAMIASLNYRATVDARWHRLVPCSGGHHFCAGHECLYRYRDRFDDSSRLWCPTRATRWEERLERVGLRARGAMARDCLFRRDHRRRVRHFRVVGFSTDEALRPGGSRWMRHRHTGKPIRITAARWCAIQARVAACLAAVNNR
jgi:hypothetical protein